MADEQPLRLQQILDRISSPDVLQEVVPVFDKLAALEAENARLKGIVDKLPSKQILMACKLIEEADRLAEAADGPVPYTATMLRPAELQQCLSALWATREAAKVAEENA